MTEQRELAVWTAEHDNGWMATASENADGTWSAWAAPRNETVPVDYLEDGPEHAKIAAEYALRKKTGHEKCSTHCSRWELHGHGSPVREGMDD